MFHVRPPEPLTKDGDIASNWQSWKECFNSFMRLSGYIDESSERRADRLKNLIGRVGIEAIQNISFDNIQDKDDMDILIAKLEEYFNPPKKEVVERYQFFTRSKKQNESIEQYINSLREKAQTCNFNDMADSIVRDKVVLDTHDKILRTKLFEADNLDLPKLVKIYNDYNINAEKMKQVTEKCKAKPTGVLQKPLDNNVKRCCWRCHEQHPQGKCPAWGSKCGRCGDVNHFTHCCKDPKFKMDHHKKNDKWNNQVDSDSTKSVENLAKIKMVSLPDVPKSCSQFDVAKSAVENNSAFDFVIVNANTRSALDHSNTANHSAHLPKNTQYNFSYTNAVKTDKIVTDLYNRGENIQLKPKQMKARIETAGDVSTTFNRGGHIQPKPKPKQMKTGRVAAAVDVPTSFNRGGNIQPKQMVMDDEDSTCRSCDRCAVRCFTLCC
ncbi:PREDICTED: uncharacterized protein LOC105560394 isoform X2 [Vollenhovia emeryi]|uniref:uncharacterized protein LOC105560394 isoform X2 n=1 Tax=Vollenhovia emeryi TaxID=411798 RepID=UPI0005F585B1|nr:PREDICTED: uncharacterized protein LOC105560394 isoform X2 [Vollenhovia emeryi]